MGLIYSIVCVYGVLCFNFYDVFLFLLLLFLFVCFLLWGERSVFVCFGVLFSTFILLKNVTILDRFVIVDLENTFCSVIVCDA